jgi:hypothetical protein
MNFMDLPPSDVGLEEVIKECPNNWNKIAIRVGVSINDTQAIYNDRNAKVTALKKWRDGDINNPQDHPATWKHLLSAVDGSCGYRVAEKLKGRVEMNPSWTEWPRKTDPPQTHEAVNNSELRRRDVSSASGQPITTPNQQAEVQQDCIHQQQECTHQKLLITLIQQLSDRLWSATGKTQLGMLFAIAATLLVLFAVLFPSIWLVPVWSALIFGFYWFFSGRKEAKEDKPEKNWGMWPAHGELIVAKKKWDSITRCVIQGSYMDTGEHFTAFLVKWGRKCYFTTSYHSYLERDAMPRTTSWWKPGELKRNKAKKNKICRAVLASEYRFLYSDGDNKPPQRKGLELMSKRNIFINCERDIVAVEVEMDSRVFLNDVIMAFDGQFDTKDLQLDFSKLDDCFEDFLKFRTAIIWHHPQGGELCRSSGDILSESKNKRQFIEEGKIAYHVRTKKGSSGSPVLVTYEAQRGNLPMIVGVHSRFPNEEANKWNYGYFLLPFLSNIHECIVGNEQLKDEYVTFVLQEEA